MISQQLIDDVLESGKVRYFKIGHCTLTIKGLPKNAMKLIAVEVESEHKGKGAARTALNELCEEVDQRHAMIHLDVQPLDDETYEDGLIRFYSSLNFQISSRSNGVKMIRKPML
jgi:ribosomal protein S18 acetylase RimI-like enzyme